jgi:hypothetical protein
MCSYATYPNVVRGVIRFDRRTTEPMVHEFVGHLKHLMPEVQCLDAWAFFAYEKTSPMQRQTHVTFVFLVDDGAKSEELMKLIEDRARMVHGYVCTGVDHGGAKRFL